MSDQILVYGGAAVVATLVNFAELSTWFLILLCILAVMVVYAS